MLDNGQFLAASLLEDRQIDLRQLPHHVRCDAFIIMPQHVPDARDLRPWNFRMARLQLGAEMTARLRYDLDAPFHQPSLLPVRFEIVERYARNDAANALDSLDDIGQAQNERAIRH